MSLRNGADVIVNVTLRPGGASASRRRLTKSARFGGSERAPFSGDGRIGGSDDVEPAKMRRS